LAGSYCEPWHHITHRIPERFDHQEQALDVLCDALGVGQQQRAYRRWKGLWATRVQHHCSGTHTPSNAVDQLGARGQQRRAAVAQCSALSGLLARHLHKRQVDARGDFAQPARIALIGLHGPLVYAQLPHQGRPHRANLVAVANGVAAAWVPMARARCIGVAGCVW
jgi:hypothetical protein